MKNQQQWIFHEEHKKYEEFSAAIKFSMTGDMDSIPMPEAVPTRWDFIHAIFPCPESSFLISRDNAAMTPYLPSYAVQPAGYQPPMKKKVTFSARVGLSNLIKWYLIMRACRPLAILTKKRDLSSLNRSLPVLLSEFLPSSLILKTRAKREMEKDSTMRITLNLSLVSHQSHTSSHLIFHFQKYLGTL